MEGQPTKSSRSFGFIKLILKIAISIICLWYVSTKINFDEAAETLRKTEVIFIVLALVAFILSKILSAIRLNIYFRDISINLPAKDNIRLYWLGMFYNLFLPGSISGDAYKVILLTKKYNLAYKKATSAVLLDRVSGLLGLGILLAVFSFFVFNDSLIPILLLNGAIISIVATFLIVRRFLKDFIHSFLSTLLWGVLVQVCQVVCVLFIMRALGINESMIEYLFLFLVSSVVSILPLTIGGLGIREVVFLEGSKFFQLIESQAIMISLIFYLITLFTSAFGIYYVFRNPLTQTGEKAGN